MISLPLLPGCSTVVPIKTQTSKIKEVAACIADANSHGQCSKDKANAFASASLSGNNEEYFSVLTEMTIPDGIDDKKLDVYSGSSEGNLSQLFSNYQRKYRGNCSTSYSADAAVIAQKALLSNPNKNIHELFKIQLAGANKSSVTAPAIIFNAKVFSEFLNDLSEANSYNGLSSLQCAALEKMSHANTTMDFMSWGALIEEVSYVREYFKAYFRQGKFIQGKFKVDELYNKLKAKLKEEAPFLSEDQVTNLANSTFKKLTGKEYAAACPKGGSCEVVAAGSLELSQFVTRSGAEYGFPHVTVSFDPLADKKMAVTKIDWNKIGAEVAKVYVEAVGDKLIGLPADPRSTACKINTALCFSEQNGGIATDDFASVGEYSDKVDALVSNAVGKAIRGMGWISLNNEAIASVIESMVGTAAKKAAEKVAYCTYSCTATKIESVMHSIRLNEATIEITR